MANLLNSNENSLQSPQRMKMLHVFGTFILFTLKRFHKEKCLDAANSLSYTSLLSVVPLFALIFAGFSSFPIFHEVLTTFEQFIFSNFIPTSSEEIRLHIMKFVSNTSKITHFPL